MGWSIETLERNASDGGVIVAHWKYSVESTSTDEMGETFGAKEYGTVSFTPDPSDPNFVAFENLTQEIVLGWVWNEINKTEVESRVQLKLDEAVSPSQIMGVPW